MRTLPIGLVVGLAVAVAGCSGANSPAKVKGTITYKGQTLKAGIVYFMCEQGGQYEAAIKSDGSYQFTDLPKGNVKVLVSTETFNPDQKPLVYTQQAKQYSKGLAKGYGEYNATVGQGEHAGAKAPEGKKAGDAPAGLTKEQKEELAKVFVKIPAKYAAEKTSPLTITLEGGSQTKDFDLTD